MRHGVRFASGVRQCIIEAITPPSTEQSVHFTPGQCQLSPGSLTHRDIGSRYRLIDRSRFWFSRNAVTVRSPGHLFHTRRVYTPVSRLSQLHFGHKNVCVRVSCVNCCTKIFFSLACRSTWSSPAPNYGPVRYVCKSAHHLEILADLRVVDVGRFMIAIATICVFDFLIKNTCML